MEDFVMKDQSIYIPVETARHFIEDVFQKLEVPAEDSRICADVLIASDLRGIDSHGIGRLKTYYICIRDGKQFPKTKFQIVKETATTATVDGGYGMGHVIGYRAMELAIKKAKTFGLGAVAVRNSTHYGIAGYYPLMAVKENMMGLTVTNARRSVAPTFGVEPMLGTNPLAFGAPSDQPYPFLIDGATSISQRGKIEFLNRAEMSTPKGWAINDHGNTLTDTNRLLKELTLDKAALLPLGGAGELLGGHKGYGYATMVEILSAALQDGNYLKNILGYDEQSKNISYTRGHFFLAINIESFVDVEICKRIVGEIMRELQESQKMPNQSRIYVAGEKEYEMEKIRKEQGIPVNHNLQKDLKAIQNALGLTIYDFLP
jgi:L-2-hydroxycarboxylate dehydrogenase (NAD+)